ncbi:glutathione S-transferase 1-like [Danaus plexippus]|uniref:glutathione S-transferase 1-like n=1 Tax=Danaus plexippus TaxID=13037 RepID=UPI002AAF9C4D|nr:glutathione S-transferase 1-like [Danaus plexippus]
MVLTLYGIEGSPPVRAVLMVIEKLNIPDVEFIQVDLMKQEHKNEQFLKMNPHHTVPTLKDDDFIIWDSHAITAYLVSKYGKEKSLYPTELKQRATVDQRLHFDSGMLFPALIEAIKPIFYNERTSFKPETLEKISNVYELTEMILNSTWLAGDNLTLADICCYATVSTLNIALPVNAQVYPKLSAWTKRCSQLDFVKKANLPGLTMLDELVKSKLA